MSEMASDSGRIEGYGITRGGLDAFRREVETSDAFAALLASRITELTLISSYA
jgi:hypothetical protein